jgi:prepilin-type N-terminal cleavage/methylation domain-containing protein
MFVKRSFYNNGFTFIEILLSLALISIIAGIGIPVFQSLQNKNNLDLTVQSFVQTFRRAQALSQGVQGDSLWGVSIASSTITLFKGNTFASRDSLYDEIYEIPSSIIASSSEIIFSKVYGEPNITSTISFTSLLTNEQKNVLINNKGTLTY